MKGKSLFILLLLQILLQTSCNSRDLYNFTTDNEFSAFVIDNFNSADNRYNAGKYKSAIHYYKKVVSAYECNKNNRVYYQKPTENAELIIKQYEKYYYSLYNIACCYALLKKNKEADRYLRTAVYAGYPHLNHLLADADLKRFFDGNPHLREEITDFFKSGNDSAIIANKVIRYVRGPSSAAEYAFSADGFTAIMYDETDDSKGNYRLIGTYKVINNFIVIQFTDEDYLETHGYILGPGMREEDCKKVHNKANIGHIIPIFSIGNTKGFYEWPFVRYKEKL